MKSIVPQRAQASELLMNGPDDFADRAVNAGPAITGMIDGEIVVCLGKATQWKGRHIIWSVMSNKAGKHMVRIVRAMRRLVDAQTGEGRLEIIVRADFTEGCKLAKMMGFKMHHHEEQFMPDGSDANIFVRFI
jgi:hypothetical protein